MARGRESRFTGERAQLPEKVSSEDIRPLVIVPCVTNGSKLRGQPERQHQGTTGRPIVARRPSAHLVRSLTR